MLVTAKTKLVIEGYDITGLGEDDLRIINMALKCYARDLADSDIEFYSSDDHSGHYNAKHILNPNSTIINRINQLSQGIEAALKAKI